MYVAQKTSEWTYCMLIISLAPFICLHTGVAKLGKDLAKLTCILYLFKDIENKVMDREEEL